MLVKVGYDIQGFIESFGFPKPKADNAPDKQAEKESEEEGKHVFSE
jgi:hypothetical protein